VTIVFSPYHNFSHSLAFIEAFKRLEANRRVAPSAIGIPTHHSSIIFKLRSAKQHLDVILSMKEWVVPTLANATSSGTIATGSALTSIPSMQVSPTAYDISGNLDDFFGNIASAFDYFAQIVNLLYFSRPFPQRNVTFNKFMRMMRNKRPTESINANLLSTARQQWYVDLKQFRHRATHQNIIDCQVFTSQSLTQTSPYSLTKILLPDNPFNHMPTYRKNRDTRFVENIFRNALGALDQMFEIMESKIRTVNQVPV